LHKTNDKRTKIMQKQKHKKNEKGMKESYLYGVLSVRWELKKIKIKTK
jgi:hypothetical protein